MCTCVQQKTQENVDKHVDESIINSEKKTQCMTKNITTLRIKSLENCQKNPSMINFLDGIVWC